MSTPLNSVSSVPPRIRTALGLHRAEIQAAFYEMMFSSLVRVSNSTLVHRSREVATLLYFFLDLEHLQKALNAALKREGLTVECKGVFGHKSGRLGPVVDFDVSPGKPGCELCDFLMIVTYGEPTNGVALGNAIFLQAKLQRTKLTQGSSSQRQCALYGQATAFRFRNPGAYSSPELADHTTRGYREMPGAATSGFVYWSFEERSEPWQWTWQASSIATPIHLNDPTRDLAFGEAMYGVIAGDFGLPVQPVQPGDYGWNRIVHDVILRAIDEPLGDTQGIAVADDVRRLANNPNLIARLLRANIAIKANPFRKLAGWLGSKAIAEAADRHSEVHSSLSEERLMKLLHEDDDGGKPPTWDEPPGPEDPGGSGSFIHINISEEGETVRVMPRTRRVRP